MSLEPRQPAKTYISIPEYARRLGISRIAVYKKVKQGLIPAKKVGRNYVIPTDETRSEQSRALRKSHISIPELAKQLGLSRIAVYQKVKSGQIPAEKIGRNYVIPVKDWEDLTPAKPVVKPKAVKVTSLMTIPELAKRLGISRIAVYQQVKNGKIKARKVGRNYAIEPQQLTGISPEKIKKKAVAEDFVSLPECARAMGISRFALYQKIKKGEVKAKQIGRNFVIHREEAEKHSSERLDKKRKGKK